MDEVERLEVNNVFSGYFCPYDVDAREAYKLTNANIVGFKPTAL